MSFPFRTNLDNKKVPESVQENEHLGVGSDGVFRGHEGRFGTSSACSKLALNKSFVFHELVWGREREREGAGRTT